MNVKKLAPKSLSWLWEENFCRLVRKKKGSAHLWDWSQSAVLLSCVGHFFSIRLFFIFRIIIQLWFVRLVLCSIPVHLHGLFWLLQSIGLQRTLLNYYYPLFRASSGTPTVNINQQNNSNKKHKKVPSLQRTSTCHTETSQLVEQCTKISKPNQNHSSRFYVELLTWGVGGDWGTRWNISSTVRCFSTLVFFLGTRLYVPIFLFFFLNTDAIE